MKNPAALEQLLRRGDIWRGHSRTFIPQEVFASGFADLDRALLNSGWPKGKLIECCFQHKTGSGEWLLFNPVIKTLCQQQPDACLVLLNPPAIPFAPALIRNGISLRQLLIIESNNKRDFINCFVEFSRSAHCLTLLAWQRPYNLNYSELRKCQLACTEGHALYTLFRPYFTSQQSSPAPLRFNLNLGATHLELEIFKQRGLFNTRHVVLKTSDEVVSTSKSYEKLAQHL